MVFFTTSWLQTKHISVTNTECYSLHEASVDTWWSKMDGALEEDLLPLNYSFLLREQREAVMMLTHVDVILPAIAMEYNLM